MSQDVSKYETIDHSYLNLIYHVKTKASANDTEMQFEDDMVLLIGKSILLSIVRTSMNLM